MAAFEGHERASVFRVAFSDGRSSAASPLMWLGLALGLTIFLLILLPLFILGFVLFAVAAIVRGTLRWLGSALGFDDEGRRNVRVIQR
ncbi:MAG: hypothetical protein AAFR38_09870 [Planctomycetota bacterium]